MSAAERDTPQCTILRYEKRVATLRNTPPLWPFLLLLVVWLGGGWMDAEPRICALRNCYKIEMQLYTKVLIYILPATRKFDI